MSCTKVGRGEMTKYVMYAFDPDFHKISMSDIVGRNFRGGSSREEVMMRGEL
jgi:3-isopropylmalate dehydratase small subunit